MSGFGILMLVFGTALLLVGVYMFNGHKLDILTWRVAFRNLKIDEWKRIGKYTIYVSFFIFILGIIAIIFKFE